MSRFISIVGSGNHLVSCKNFLNTVMFVEHVGSSTLWYHRYNHTIIASHIGQNTQHGIVFFGNGSYRHVDELWKRGIKFDCVWPQHVLANHIVYEKKPYDHYLPDSDEVDWNRFFKKLGVDIGF